MNFKTTMVLLGALIVVGGAFYVNQRREKNAPQQTDEATGQKLIDVAVADVQSLTITAADGKRIAVGRVGLSWQLTSPVTAPALDLQTRDLIHTIGEVQSQGRLADASAADTGLDNPQYRIDILMGDKKTTHQLVIGNKTPLGDQMYARADGGDVNLIDTSLLKTLKTATDDIRDKHLFNVPVQNASDVRVTYGDVRMELIRGPEDKWKVVDLRKKQEMPGDDSMISTYLAGLGGVVATNYLSKGADELAFAGFDHPTLKVWAGIGAPAEGHAATAPSDSNSAWIAVGTPDLTKEHYVVEMSDGQQAKIGSAFVNNLEKTPLDLRDKEAVTILPDDVSEISIVKETYPPAPTKPTAQSAALKPAITERIEMDRRPKLAAGVVGPAAPAKPGSAASSRPAAPDTVWEFKDTKGPVDDAKVGLLLERFDPLRAAKYLEKAPDSAWSQRYVVTLKTGKTGSRSAKSYRVEVIQPVDSETSYAIYDGLTFEVLGIIPESIDVDFHKTGP